MEIESGLDREEQTRMKGNSTGRAMPRNIETLREQGKRTHLLTYHLELQKSKKDKLVSIPSFLELLRTGI